MSNFIMLVGLPGSGKSTYTKSFSSNTVILSSDAIRMSMGFDPGCGSDVVFPEMLKRTKLALQTGHDVVYDATNMVRKNRMHVLQEVKKYCDKRECVLFLEPVTVCAKRNKQRDAYAKVPDDCIIRMVKSFNVPMYCEGFDTITLVQTSDESSVLTLHDLYAMTIGFEQDNPHHTLTLQEHQEKAAELVKGFWEEKYGNKNLPDTLHFAALYHDIGKLYTKKFENAKGEKTEFAHFYQHENVGAYLYLVATCAGVRSFYKVREILHTAALINWHMRLYVEMNPKKREKQNEMLGHQFVTELEILHKADELAH